MVIIMVQMMFHLLINYSGDTLNIIHPDKVNYYNYDFSQVDFISFSPGVLSFDPFGSSSFIKAGIESSDFYSLNSGDSCSIQLGLGAFTNQTEMETELLTLGNEAAIKKAFEDASSCSIEAKSSHVLFEVLSQESDGMVVTDFDNTSYGVVEIDIGYSTTTASALALLGSQVGSIDVGANGSLTSSLANAISASVGNTSGSISTDATTSLGFTC